MDLLITNSQLVDYTRYLWIIVMFISAVWTLFLTAPIHCRGSIDEQVCNAIVLRMCSDEETNSPYSLNLFIFLRLQSQNWTSVGTKPTYPAFFRGSLVVDQPTDTFVKLPVSIQQISTPFYFSHLLFILD